MPLAYAEYCPLARAAEVVGERWTLLIVRELLMGPQRFTDLRQRLPGVSPSVLSERLARLEEVGLLARRNLEPPAASVVYELTATGRALEPAVTELARWGARFLGLPRPGERLEPRALRLGLHFLAPLAPTPRRRIEVRVPDGDSDMVFHVCGGARGTRVVAADAPADAAIRGEPFALVALLAGAVDVDTAIEHGTVQAEGDRAALRDLPDLFQMQRGDGPQAPPSNQE